jgi:DNA repair protein RecO (recombination protein O)
MLPTPRRRTVTGIVWKRSDFRETSRIVTLITREEGKLTALVKGAHRKNSPAQGRIDLFNRVQATLTGAPGTLPLLSRLRLEAEPRGLREPRRYLAACHLHDAFDPALTAGRIDAALFDLLAGGLTLLERCPPRALATVLAGLELRYLEVLGLLPELDRCSQCGAPAGRLFVAIGHPGLLCRAHARGAEAAAAPAALRWLRALQRTPGRAWAGLPPPPRDGRAHALLGAWLAAATERRARFRTAALRRSALAAAQAQ